MCGSNQSKLKRAQMEELNKRYMEELKKEEHPDHFIASREKILSNDYGYTVKPNINFKPQIPTHLSKGQLESTKNSQIYVKEVAPFSPPILEVYQTINKVNVEEKKDNFKIENTKENCTLINFDNSSELAEKTNPVNHRNETNPHTPVRTGRKDAQSASLAYSNTPQPQYQNYDAPSPQPSPMINRAEQQSLEPIITHFPNPEKIFPQDPNKKLFPENFNTKNHQTQKFYEDPEFLPERNSIVKREYLNINSTTELALASEDQRITYAKQYLSTSSWQTPIESNLPLKLFTSDSLLKNVHQGALFNDYFLAVLGSIATFPNRLNKLLVSAGGAKNLEFFIFAVNVNGIWQKVQIDSFLPFYKKAFMFGNDEKRVIYRTKFIGSQAKNDQLWVNYFEKMYAKVMGSYFSIGYGGEPSHVFMDLTGAPAETVDLDSFADMGAAWDFIKTCFGFGFMLCAESCHNDRAATKYGFKFKNFQREKMKIGYSKFSFMKKELGIVDQQSYTFLGIEEVDGKRLVKLRNVWGRTEWLGEWGDGSPEWLQISKDKLDHNHANDGIFYMPFRDFKKLFTKVYVCYYVENNVFSCVKLEDRDLENRMHCFELTVKKAGSYCIRLSQGSHQKWALKSTKGNIEYAALTLLITKDNGIYTRVVAGKKESERDVWVRANLSPGNYKLFVSLIFSLKLGKG